MADDDSLGEDYFDDDGGGGLDDQAMNAMMADEGARDLVKLYMGIETEQHPDEFAPENTNGGAPEDQKDKPEEEFEEKIFFEDSEEEKEFKRKKKELEGFQDVVAGYTEDGQMKLLNEQVEEMVRRKNKLRDKIKEFMASTFDPLIFSSISRLIVVEMLAYHQNVFERLYQEVTITAITSCLTMKELRFVLSFKKAFSSLKITSEKDMLMEQQGLLQVAALYCKGILTKHSKELKKIIRKDTPQEPLESGLTSFEVVAFFGAMLTYLGFKTRCCFLVSFDKLNLDLSYKLDMYGDKGSKRNIPMKTKKAPKKKQSKKPKKRTSFVGEQGDNEEQGSSYSEASEVDSDGSGTSRSRRSKKTTESEQKMYEYEPLSNSSFPII